MGDVHFILRHAMTGAIFFIFAAAGLIWAGGTLPSTQLLDSTGGEVLISVIAFPIVGITIQGAHVGILTLTKGLFEDPARKVIASEVRQAFVEAQKDDPTNLRNIEWKYLEQAPDDAFFVWLYHGCAGAEMIEWARRRRSYYYLGINWVTAAIAGFVAGAVVALQGRPPDWLLLLLAILWAAGALWAARRMRRDADTMEAIWAASMCHPQLRQRLGQMLPLLRDDGVSTRGGLA